LLACPYGATKTNDRFKRRSTAYTLLHTITPLSG
jgi:hypothetical protein